MGYLVPLVGVAGGVVLFNEALTTNLILGGALILAGVTLVGKAGHRVGLASPG
jgi:drug/metabolite transporter (DMT)-like permease